MQALKYQPQVLYLLEQFINVISYFDQRNTFTGPSLYFHSKTIQLGKQFSSPGKAVNDICFVESIYATLASWGMHRMGKQGAKLVEFNVFYSSLQQLAPALDSLQSYRLPDIDESQLSCVFEKVWNVINSLQAGVGRTKIVVGSKVLHHILPYLIPPIDREYTLHFFYQNKNLNNAEKRKFIEIMSGYYRISIAKREDISRICQENNPWHSSPTKVIDNAIVGYVWKYFKDNEVESKPSILEEPNIMHKTINPSLPDPEGHAAQIFRAAVVLDNSEKHIFARLDVRDHLGMNGETWNAGFSAIFQGMRDDHPGGAPQVAKQFKGVFHRVSHGKYRLTDYGKELASQLGYG